MQRVPVIQVIKMLTKPVPPSIPREQRITLTEEERKENRREIARRYYENHKDEPEFKAKRKEIRERQKCKPGYMESRRESQRRYYHKHKDEPEFKEKNREKDRRNYQRILNDPVRLEECRQRNHEQYLKRKSNPDHLTKMRENNRRYRERKRQEAQNEV